MSEAQKPSGSKKKKRVRAPIERVHPKAAAIAHIVGCPRAEVKFFAVSREAAGQWETLTWDDGDGIDKDRWSMALFSLALIRERWGTGRFRCIWYAGASDRPRPGRAFTLTDENERERDDGRDDDDDDMVEVSRTELEALIHAARERSAPPRDPKEPPGPWDFMRMIREERNDATKSAAELFKLALSARDAVSAPASSSPLPPKVRDIVDEWNHGKLADALAERLGIKAGVTARADDEEEEDDEHFDEWSEIWDLLSDDMKQEVGTLVRENKPKLNVIVPAIFGEIRKAVAEARKNGAPAVPS